MMADEMITAPPPMTVTFVRDLNPERVSLVEPAWPARLHVDGKLLDEVHRGLDCQGTMFFDGDELRFTLANAAATYRIVDTSGAERAWYLIRDLYLFDCVAWSRDLTDGE